MTTYVGHMRNSAGGRGRVIAGAALAAAAIMCLSGCTSTPPAAEATNTILDYAAAQREYADAVAKLPAPEGFSYPAQFSARTDELFEEGFGEARAVTFWNCAWGQEWLLLRADDPAAAAEALNMYESVKDTDVFARLWDEVSIQQPFLDAIERARLGDPSRVQADVQANCS